MKSKFAIILSLIMFSSLIFISKINAQDEYSSWVVLDDNVKYQIKCKYIESMNKYKTFFKFMRTDPETERTGDRKYINVKLSIPNYDKPVKIRFAGETDWVYHMIPFEVCKMGLDFPFEVTY